MGDQPETLPNGRAFGRLQFRFGEVFPSVGVEGESAKIRVGPLLIMHANPPALRKNKPPPDAT
jgi:hypothetical protein